MGLDYLTENSQRCTVKVAIVSTFGGLAKAKVEMPENHPGF
jgi:hypothetical protein